MKEQLSPAGEEAPQHPALLVGGLRTSSRNASSESVPDWIDHVSIAQPIVL